MTSPDVEITRAMLELLYIICIVLAGVAILQLIRIIIEILPKKKTTKKTTPNKGQ